MNDDSIGAAAVIRWGASLVAILAMILVLIFGLVAGAQAFGRYQRLQDEQNQVQVNDIQIAQTKQLVEVEKQKAAIRVQDAQGIAQSQAIINGTLSPAYLQYMAIQAQIDMANKSDHSATVYIPVGPNGLPVVATQPVKG